MNVPELTRVMRQMDEEENNAKKKPDSKREAGYDPQYGSIVTWTGIYKETFDHICQRLPQCPRSHIAAAFALAKWNLSYEAVADLHGTTLAPLLDGKYRDPNRRDPTTRHAIRIAIRDVLAAAADLPLPVESRWDTMMDKFPEVVLIVDGTAIWAQAGDKHYNGHYNGKIYKLMVLVNFLGQICEAYRVDPTGHDSRQFGEQGSALASDGAKKHFILSDGGFGGLRRNQNIIRPFRNTSKYKIDPKSNTGNAETDKRSKREAATNKFIQIVRAKVEHTFGRMSYFAFTRDCRLREKTANNLWRLCAHAVNFELGLFYQTHPLPQYIVRRPVEFRKLEGWGTTMTDVTTRIADWAESQTFSAFVGKPSTNSGPFYKHVDFGGDDADDDGTGDVEKLPPMGTNALENAELQRYYDDFNDEVYGTSSDDDSEEDNDDEKTNVRWTDEMKLKLLALSHDWDKSHRKYGQTYDTVVTNQFNAWYKNVDASRTFSRANLRAQSNNFEWAARRATADQRRIEAREQFRTQNEIAGEMRSDDDDDDDDSSTTSASNCSESSEERYNNARKKKKTNNKTTRKNQAKSAKNSKKPSKTAKPQPKTTCRTNNNSNNNENDDSDGSNNVMMMMMMMPTTKNNKVDQRNTRCNESKNQQNRGQTLPHRRDRSEENLFDPDLYDDLFSNK